MFISARKCKKDEMVSDYNFSYYSFFLRGIWGLKVVTICYYKYLYINIYYYIFIYTFLYLHFISVILGQNKTVITEIVICNRFFSGIEMHTFIAPKTMPISSQSYELWPTKLWVSFFNIKKITRSKLDFDWKSRSWAFAYII